MNGLRKKFFTVYTLEVFMMKVLVLEDDLERMKHIRRSLIGHLHTHVTSAEAAVEAIQCGAYDALMLDHDLGDEHYNGRYDDRTGMAVVDWLVVNTFPFKCIIIHSYNTVRGREMYLRLSDAGYNAIYSPGCWFDANRHGCDIFQAVGYRE
jgi:CheY-like chemotaxis protein